MYTEKLYDLNSYITDFSATVCMCRELENGYAVTLDRTAFCPEGGGQAGDTGVLGNSLVLATYEENGDIIHLTNRPLPIGEAVDGKIDFKKRFDRMQNHTGEHIVSGLIHRYYGYDNVGFHLSDREMTMDFDGPLSREQLDVIESEANKVVAANIKITVSYPEPDALSAIPYRSKRDITGPVRIVTVPGYDVCACCAPHVAYTGEVGQIKLLECIRYKGGVRIHAVCGKRALLDYREKFSVLSGISHLLSLPGEECEAGVERLLAELSSLKLELAEARRTLTAARVASLSPNAAGNMVCLLPAGTDEISLRETALLGAERASGVSVALVEQDGGYRVMIAAKNRPLKETAAQLRAELGLRGGGSNELLQGSIKKPYTEIEAYFEKPI